VICVPVAEDQRVDFARIGPGEAGFIAPFWDYFE